jgi:tetratricopeptide (TPR) repeat protein
MASEKANKAMNKHPRVSVPTGRWWQQLRLWTCTVCVLLSNSCVLAAPPSGSVSGGLVPDPVMASDAVAWDPESVVQRSQAYYRYILSYAFQLRTTIPDHLTRAVDELQSALQTQPDEVFLLTELAQLQLGRGKLDEALKVAQAAVEHDPKHYPGYLLLGRIYSRLQQYEASQEALNQALKLRPDEEDAYLDLGTLQATTNRQEEAVKTLQRLLQIKPESLRGLYALGRLQAERGQYDDAVALLKRALAERPEFDQALRILGTVYELQKRHAEAIEVYQELIERNPYHKTARYRLAELYIRQHDLDKALEVYQTLAQMEPEDVQYRLRMGLIYLRRQI